MRRTILTGIVMTGCLCGGACSSVLNAQTNDRQVWSDMAYIRDSNPRLTSENASGLKELTVDNISAAELSFDKGSGQFVNYYQSDNQYRYGAEAESFYRLSPRVVFYGKIGYSSSEGKHMWGASFIDPGYNPFTVIESTDSTTRGEKRLEKYQLSGAFSAMLTSRLTVGGRLDYTAANYAKFRDPRHKNSYTDIVVTPGLTYRFSGRVTAGINGYYRRSVEGISYKAYVGTELPYTSFINFGSFYGRAENFGTSGYTDLTDEQPMLNKHIGGSLQLDVRLSTALTFYNEFSYRSRSGSYGRDATAKVLYSKHTGEVYSYKGVLSYKKGNASHHLSGNVTASTLENNENIYKYETTPLGNTNVVYYGETQMLDQDAAEANIDYKGYFGLHDNTPIWTVNAGTNYTSRKQTTSLYPFYRKQNIHTQTVYLNAGRNILKGTNMFTLTAGLNYGSGGGTPKKDGYYATPSDTQKPPVSMDDLLMQEYEYLTAVRAGGKLGIGYSRFLNRDIRGYAALTYHLTSAQDITYLKGSNYHLVEIKVGCSF